MLVMATAALGTAILRSARLFLIEQALCRAYYETADPAVVRPDGSVDESRCKANGIQADVALVSGLFEVMTLISGERNVNMNEMANKYLVTNGLRSHRIRLGGDAGLYEIRVCVWQTKGFVY